MPMAGLGTRFSNQGYDLPKPLIDVLGKPIVQWSVETMGLEGNYIFCCKKEHLLTYDLEKKLRSIKPNCTIVPIEYQTEGTAQTVLEARKFIDNDEELIISDSDPYLVWNADKFNSEIRPLNIDACVMVFPGKSYSPVSSYVKLDDNGYVVESAEKVPISTIATTGVHYFKKGSDFVHYCDEMIKNNIRQKNEFYISTIYNLFANNQKKVIIFPVDAMFPLGNPNEVEIFLKEHEKLENGGF